MPYSASFEVMLRRDRPQIRALPDVAARAGQGLADVSALNRGHGLAQQHRQRPIEIDGEGSAALQGLIQFRGQVLPIDHRVLAGDAGALDDVLQLAHVPRPGMREQQLHGRGRNFLGASPRRANFSQK